MGKARRKYLTMLVTVNVPATMGNVDARSETRLQLANGIAAFGRNDVKLVSVAPLPADRVIKPRKKPERREVPPLLAAMQSRTQENDNAD